MASANEDLNPQQEILDTSDTCLAFACEFVTFIRYKLNLPIIRLATAEEIDSMPLINPEEEESLEKFLPLRINISEFYEKLKRRCSKAHEPKPFTEEFFEEMMEEIPMYCRGRNKLLMKYSYMACLGVYADAKGLLSGLGLATFSIKESLLQEVQQKYPDLDRIGVKEICHFLQIHM